MKLKETEKRKSLKIVKFRCPKCKAVFPVNKNQYRYTNKGLMVLCVCPQCHRYIKSYNESPL